MNRLTEIRSLAGLRITVGLNDSYIERFLAKDLNLALAISQAYEEWKKLKNEKDGGSESFKKPEGELIRDIEQGWCHLYPEDTRNPYVPLSAKGPWIVTLHGAVLHDNGGYGMLGLGHSPTPVLEAMSKDSVMANIMTPSLGQKKFMGLLRKEIGRNRPNGCPFASFLLMNSGSEGNSVADRLMDIHTGHVMKNIKRSDTTKVKIIALKGCFHGRTYRPALWTDACKDRYNSAGVYSIQKTYEEDYCWISEVNDSADLERLFKKAEEEDVYIEAMFMESVMGEGNPGVAISPEFYETARRLTLKHDSMLLVDNIQAGLRTTGNLSIVDYPGFETLDCPDFEVYSKAINGGQFPVSCLALSKRFKNPLRFPVSCLALSKRFQNPLRFPVSCLALSKRAESFYRHGVYGNTMTGNPRACLVAAAVLESITPEIRNNIVQMGNYAIEGYKKMMKDEFPDLITSVNGTGLLYAVQLNDKVFSVVAKDGAEYVLRKQGLGVIHGGHNALRFTPHFNITKDELDMQFDFVRAFLKRLSSKEYMGLMPRMVAMSELHMKKWNLENNWVGMSPSNMSKVQEESLNMMMSPQDNSDNVNKNSSVPGSEMINKNSDSKFSNTMAKSGSFNSLNSRINVDLQGNIFDESIINHVLDLIEKHHGSAKVLSLRLGNTVQDASTAKIDVLVPNEAKDMLLDELKGVKGVKAA